MTLHYHGTPITPREVLLTLAGKSFCVSFAEPRDADVCIKIGQMILWDNGAFSLHTKGKPIDEQALYRWLGPRLCHPHRAVVLDRIGGSVEEQREMVKRWPFDRDLSWPVWHLDKPLDYLLELADAWPGVCLGSAGEYWNINAEPWRRRMDETFNYISRHRVRVPWLHGLRMLGKCSGPWPLASADSTNVARNHAGAPSRGTPRKDAEAMARRIDSVQAPLWWEMSDEAAAACLADMLA